MADLHPLEEAAIAVRSATDGRGLKIYLLPSQDMFRIDKVREAVRDAATPFASHGAALTSEYAAARNLALLANLLAENIKERDAIAAA